MRKGEHVRILLSAAVLLGAASCTQYQGWGPTSWLRTPPPGQLTLSNNRFDHAAIQAVMAPGPDCAPIDPAAPATAFDLPFKGTRVLVAAPNTDICWRQQISGGLWNAWNRAFTASGKFIDAQL